MVFENPVQILLNSQIQTQCVGLYPLLKAGRKFIKIYSRSSRNRSLVFQIVMGQGAPVFIKYVVKLGVTKLTTEN